MIQKAKFIFVLFLVFFIIACDTSSDSEPILPFSNIDEELILLKSEPNNCLVLDHVATRYLVNHHYQAAIGYFEKLLENCPKNSSSRFQMGIAYLFIDDLDKAILTMDRAISDVEAEGDTTWANTLKDEKRRWLQAKANGKFNAVRLD